MNKMAFFHPFNVRRLFYKIISVDFILKPILLVSIGFFFRQFLAEVYAFFIKKKDVDVNDLTVFIT